jgi:hypothetical protein
LQVLYLWGDPVMYMSALFRNDGEESVPLIRRDEVSLSLIISF